MMKIYFSITIVFIAMASAYSQGQLSVVDRSINPGMVIEEFASKDVAEEEVSYYFNDTWLRSYIELKNGVALKGFPVKFDMLKDHLELQVDETIKICPSHLIERFAIIDPISGDSTIFVDAKNFKFPDGVPFVGFLEIVEEGSYSLVARYKINRQESNYVEALDMGSKEAKLIKNEEFFITKDKEVLCELENKVKKLDCPEITSTLSNDFKMKTKTVSDKIEFINYLNQ